MTVFSKFPHLLHGGDYNPDQWLDRPDILEKDIEYMKKAHINCVSLGIFSWSTLEPEEGVYRFDWMEQIIDRLYHAGIDTILATPSAAMPHWLAYQYPEVNMVSARRIRNLPGNRHNFCPTSPVMRQKAARINRRLAQHFSAHPGVIAWHISNELGGNDDEGQCHCPLCQQAFRTWLKKKYGTLDALNHAWWTPFWSRTYTQWEQIESPAPNGERCINGLKLDWKRFCSDQITDYCADEIKALREGGSNLPTIVNLMYFFKPYNYFKLAQTADIVSWDSYPSWHCREDEYHPATETAFQHDLMRSLKRQPFLLMESAPSAASWKQWNTLKRPGMHMLSSLQAVAHGSDSVQYFQIRKGRGCAEKFHGAVIGHQNSCETRVFHDVASVGKCLENLSDLVCGTCNQAQAAIVFDWENWWAVEDAAAIARPVRYKEVVLSHYRPFFELGIGTDIVDMEQDLDGYQLVVAPMLYMLKPEFAEKIRRFVSKGGIFVTTYWSGIVDENDLCYMDHIPGLLTDVLGIEEEEIDAVGPHRPNGILYRGEKYPVGNLRDLIHPTSAQVLAAYTDDFYRGMAAVTKNQFGEGSAYYLAAELGIDFLKPFYQEIAAQAGIRPDWEGALPRGVSVSSRCSAGRKVLFVQNFLEEAVDLPIRQRYRDAQSDRMVSGQLHLQPFECAVLVPEEDESADKKREETS